ncbi:MAG: hypothetical protein K0U29_00485 [Gammaproteobacteria bacterium]|nr:hypothetical protein [Gammaproteobacteria bacterium]
MFKKIRQLIQRVTRRRRTATGAAHQPNQHFKDPTPTSEPQVLLDSSRGVVRLSDIPAASSRMGRYGQIVASGVTTVDPDPYENRVVVAKGAVTEHDPYEDRANAIIPRIENLCAQLIKHVSSGDWAQAKITHDLLVETDTEEKDIYENLLFLKATHFDRVRALKSDVIGLYTLSLMPNACKIAALHDRIKRCLSHPQTPNYSDHHEMYQQLRTQLSTVDANPNKRDATSATAARTTGAFAAPATTPITAATEHASAPRL